jgi:D-alanyl-lipoteichoic acid acyltransferase DltB (MBOAT superfamily)
VLWVLFNSYEFIFIFLPIVLIGYFFVLRKASLHTKMIWLVLASLFFYGYWTPKYLYLIISSIIINFGISKLMLRFEKHKKLMLTLGILFNVSLLGYYKYTNFFIDNLNYLIDKDIILQQIILPLGISFFTFQQIAFIIDSYKGETRHYRFFEYCLFVTFFPQLIAGPIVHHKEMMPQFEVNDNARIHARNFALGIYIFILGLGKKVLIADNFASVANMGYGAERALSFFESWITSLAYTMQLYFDFSGYCDMAIGAALLFNIKLPLNFNSPYKALNIQDFWRRWHMTLNRFLTQYIYFPLGGSQVGKYRTYFNIFVIFFISGIWHGAGWTFVVWGVLHGLASMIYRAWKTTNISLPKWSAWLLTFLFVNAAWIFFRSETLRQALSILKGMIGLNGIEFPSIANAMNKILPFHIGINVELLYTSPDILKYSIVLLVFLGIVIFSKNTMERMNEFNMNVGKVIVLSIITVASILSLSKVSEFLYFNF